MEHGKYSGQQIRIHPKGHVQGMHMVNPGAWDDYGSASLGTRYPLPCGYDDYLVLR